MRGRRAGAGVAFASLLVLLASVPGVAHADGGPIVITPVAPAAGSVVTSPTPVISLTYTDSAGTIDTSQVFLFVDGLNVTGVQETVITSAGVTYSVPSILKLANGNHTVLVSVTDTAGHTASYSWGFTVNTAAAAGLAPGSFLDLRELLVEIGVGAGLVAAGFGAYILYLKRTRRFTFRKYFATHPVKKEYLVLYVPLVASFLFVVVGLLFVESTPGFPPLSPEYVVIGGIFIALTAYALDARREKQRVRAYERAFAQFLFEMADAMRGGIDPAKAVVELAKTQRNIMAPQLRVASDGIRLGRPFDVVLKNMAAPMRSPLVRRYAALIADASSVGGETAAVVYRAAKDMDDFVKIELERTRQLFMPVAVLYIAYGVLLAVLFSLLYIAPSIGGLSFSFLGSTPLSGGSPAATGVSIAPLVLKQRFFDLTMVVSVGTGIIIGAFTEGHPKYGLLHSLALAAGTAIAFLIVFP